MINIFVNSHPLQQLSFVEKVRYKTNMQDKLNIDGDNISFKSGKILPQGRLDYIDEISGVLIVVMVLEHVTYNCDYGYYPFLRLFFFYMPWFFFKSGFFHKNQRPRILFKKTLYKFLRTYVIFWVIGLLVSIFLWGDVIGTVVINA